jgi:hypothetical protein
MTPQRRADWQPGIELVEARTPAHCPRCGSEVLLTARVPHSWLNNRGDIAQGTGKVILCPSCGADDPLAGPLVAFFSVHGQVTSDTADEFTDLLNSWITQVGVPSVDYRALEDERQAWHRGEFDEDETRGPYLLRDDRLEWADRPESDWP